MLSKVSILSAIVILTSGITSAKAQTNRVDGDFGKTSLKAWVLQQKALEESNTDDGKIIHLTLNQCIEKALKENPIIQKYKLEVEAQKNLFYAAKTKWLPTIEFEGAPALSQYYERASQDLIVPQPSQNISNTGQNVSNSSLNEYDIFSLEQNIGADVYVEWNIIDMTRTPLIKSEWQLIKQKQNLLKLAARKLIAEVTISYINAQAAQKTIDDLQPLINASIQSEKNLEKQLEIGYSDISQLFQSQTQLLNIINTLVVAKGERDKYSAELASLIGNKSEQFIYPSEELKAPERFRFNLGEAVSMSIKNNELAKAYIDESESMKWESISRINKYIPKLFLYLNWYYGNAWGISDAPVSNPSISENSYSGKESGYYAGIGFSWRFDAGADYFSAKSKEITSLSLVKGAQSAEISFAGLTKSNYALNQSAMNSIDISLKAMKTSSDNLKALKVRSEYGLEDMTTIVQAFSLYNQSLTQWIEAVRLANISLTNLYRYTSWLPDEGKIDSLLEKK